MPGALASPHIVVAALADPVKARAEQLARTYGILPKIAERVDDIIPHIDGALIATPNHTHKDIALACLTAGIPCLVEKPLATSVPDAEEMCAAAQRAGKILAVGYTTRFRDEVVLLHDLLQSRHFGAVRRFHYQEGTVGGWSPLSGYIADRKAAGGGVLTVVGTHFIDRMLYWFGYPSSCYLLDDSEGGPEAHCLATFAYRNSGASFEGTLLLSKTAELKSGLAIDTDRGTIIFPMGRAPLYFEPRDNSRLREILSPRGPRAFPMDKSDAQLEIENFVAACRGEAVPMVDGRQGLLSVRLLSELYRSRRPLPEPWTLSNQAAGPST